MRFLATIADPNIAVILLLIGVYGFILFEYYRPGAIAPGVIGAISLLVSLAARFFLPLSYGGVAVMLMGVAMMVGQLFTPGFGLLGISGIAAFITGAAIIFVPFHGRRSDDRLVGHSSGPALTSAVALSLVLGFAVRRWRQG